MKAYPRSYIMGRIGKLLMWLLMLNACSFPATQPTEKHTLVDRGVWIAAPRHNTIMHHADSMDAQLEQLRSLGFSTLYVCVLATTKLLS
ncbi:MAG: hypothetical protein R2795_19075 [Saprospiraceae bacterium]